MKISVRESYIKVWVTIILLGLNVIYRII
jgi:hypothetical protein